jgi:hypothetical protein
MAGRGRLLLEPGFVHDEVDLPTPPVVGRNIEWPLPRTYRSYPSDDLGLQTSPSPSIDPEPEPGTSTLPYSSDDEDEPSPVPISKKGLDRLWQWSPP